MLLTEILNGNSTKWGRSVDINISSMIRFIVVLSEMLRDTYRVDCDHTVSPGTLLCARMAVHPPFLAAYLTFLLLGSGKTNNDMFISVSGPLGISLTAKAELVYILTTK